MGVKKIWKPIECDGYLLIPLTKGKYSKIDKESFDLIKDYKWMTLQKKKTSYAIRRVKTIHVNRTILMHRVILGIDETKDCKIVCDHINSDGLDNRLSNLRACSIQQNCSNRRPIEGCSSKFKGVRFQKRTNKWSSSIVFNKKKYRLGNYFSEIEAAKAYDRAAKKYFKEFAVLNFNG